MRCVFCSIVEGGLPTKTLYKDEYAQAVLDAHPLTRGHTLVLPTCHRETIGDLKEEELAPLMCALQKVVGILEKTLGADGFTIGINHGKYAGQAVSHLHIHIIPRYKGDGGGSLHSVVSSPPEESLDETYQSIVNK